MRRRACRPRCPGRHAKKDVIVEGTVFAHMLSGRDACWETAAWSAAIGSCTAPARRRHGLESAGARRRREPVRLGVATGGWADRESGSVIEHSLFGWCDVPVRELPAAATGLAVEVDGPVNSWTTPSRVWASPSTAIPRAGARVHGQRCQRMGHHCHCATYVAQFRRARASGNDAVGTIPLSAALRAMIPLAAQSAGFSTGAHKLGKFTTTPSWLLRAMMTTASSWPGFSSRWGTYGGTKM